MMRKPTKDPIREDRIHNEAIVEAYGSEEQAMSWYYYLENKIRFPFSAKCIVANLVSPLKKGFVRKNRGLIPAPVICQVSDRARVRGSGTFGTRRIFS